ncbi:MAG TPA: DNA alkylation repair protein [Saprospiraceae bacterium]|nr:DNA alkylation repair protein [Saprospiraceae bacterium]HMP14215.1 DNA alkylation repair protein [Saprospiraceae bacterium]
MNESNCPMPRDYVQRVQARYQQHASAANAAAMQRYMKDQFLFFGIKKPERVTLSEQLIRELGVPASTQALSAVCRQCFQAEPREMQYFAADLLRPRIKKYEVELLPLLEELMLEKSWWDTIDFLAPKLAGNILLRFPGAIADYPARWIDSDNFWLQRAAILFQLDYKNRTNSALLFSFIHRQADSREFFVQKAAGWALRNYSKVNPDEVRHFIMHTKLSKLTIREGSKYL